MADLSLCAHMLCVHMCECGCGPWRTTSGVYPHLSFSLRPWVFLFSSGFGKPAGSLASVGFPFSSSRLTEASDATMLSCAHLGASTLSTELSPTWMHFLRFNFHIFLAFWVGF